MEENTTRLVLWDNEPLMRMLAQRLNPVSFGIYFFGCISLPLCVLAFLFDNGIYKIGFFENISWSITIVFLFPFLAVLGFKYYEAIPKLFDHLFKEVIENATEENKAAFYKWLDARFNNHIATIIIFVFSLSLTIFFSYQKQYACQEGWFGWMYGGDLLKFSDLPFISTNVLPGCGFTGVGLLGVILQFVIGYWCVNLAFRAAVCYWGLYELFDNRKRWNFRFKVNPLHPDRCCGLGRIGDLAMLFNVIMFIIGMYVSLTVLDKLLLQGGAATDDITVPLYLGGYILLAPLLFFLPLGSARRTMKQAKIDFLRPISDRCEQLAQKSSVDTGEEPSATVDAFFEMDKLRVQVDRDIPVWPFDFRSFLKFNGAIVLPIVPVAVTLLTEFGKRILLS